MRAPVYERGIDAAPAHHVGRRRYVYLDSGARRYVYRVVARDIAVMAPTRTTTLALTSCYPFDVDAQLVAP